MLRRTFAVALVIIALFICLIGLFEPDPGVVPARAMVAAWILLSLICGALVLVVVRLMRLVRWQRRDHQETLRLSTSICVRIPFNPSRRLSRTGQLMNGLPNFGVAPGCLLILVLSFVSIKPRTPVGLRAHFGRWETFVPETLRASSTLAVYIDGKGRFVVNGKPVERKMLAIALQGELNRRETTTVYFEADDDSAYGQCVYAVDTIKGLGADLIWITPRTREQWKKSAHQ